MTSSSIAAKVSVSGVGGASVTGADDSALCRGFGKLSLGVACGEAPLNFKYLRYLRNLRNV